MKTIFKIILTVLILLVGVAIFKLLVATKPEAKKVPLERTPPTVVAHTVEFSDIAVQIKSQGEVQPEQQTTLVAEVAGKIIEISPKFEIGSRFSAGEQLMQLDQTDYISLVEQAKAAKEEANLNYQIEISRGQQAKRDWKKLGKGTEATDLVLRKPQLSTALARLESARANLEQAQKNLSRTTVVAPYDCFIDAKMVDLGSFVTVGMQLGRINSAGSVEVRFPVTLEDSAFLPDVSSQPAVQASGSYGAKVISWEGMLIRSENRIDPETRSFNLIAQFSGEQKPEVGLFVEVKLEGLKMEKIVALPRVALRDGNTVLIILEDQTLDFRTVEVIRTSEDDVFVSSGLKEGELVCATVLSTPLKGMKVNVEKPSVETE